MIALRDLILSYLLSSGLKGDKCDIVAHFMTFCPDLGQQYNNMHIRPVLHIHHAFLFVRFALTVFSYISRALRSKNQTTVDLESNPRVRGIFGPEKNPFTTGSTLIFLE